MKLTREEIERLMQMLGLTKDKELDCDQCLCLVAEFAKQNLAGKSASEGFRLIEHHLSICGECHEEFEVLRASLRRLNEP